MTNPLPTAPVFCGHEDPCACGEPEPDPTAAFQYSRSLAYRQLGDALDELRDWNLSNGLTRAQIRAVEGARNSIQAALEHLNEAAG